jgi:hypothetical protein
MDTDRFIKEARRIHALRCTEPSGCVDDMLLPANEILGCESHIRIAADRSFDAVDAMHYLVSGLRLQKVSSDGR